MYSGAKWHLGDSATFFKDPFTGWSGGGFVFFSVWCLSQVGARFRTASVDSCLVCFPDVACAASNGLGALEGLLSGRIVWFGLG